MCAGQRKDDGCTAGGVGVAAEAADGGRGGHLRVVGVHDRAGRDEVGRDLRAGLPEPEHGNHRRRIRGHRQFRPAGVITTDSTREAAKIANNIVCYLPFS